MYHKDTQKTHPQETGTASRRRFLRQGGIATAFAAVASAIGLTPFSPASAASISGKNGFEVKPLTGTKAQQYIQATFASQDYQHFEQEVTQKYARDLTIAKSEALVMNVTSRTEAAIVVRIPVSGGTNYSFYAATFSPNTSILLSTISYLSISTADGHIHATTSRDGHVVFDGILTADGSTVIQGKVSTLNATKTVQGPTLETLVSPDITLNSNCLKRCFAMFGFNSGVIGAVISACGATCSFSLTVCATCFAAALGLSAAVVGTCIVGCSS